MTFLTALELRADAPGTWVLLRALLWDDGEHRFEVPRGFITDLASIPAPLRGLLNQNGASRRAAVLHDYLCREQPVSRARADAIFRDALKAEGIGSLGRFTYWAGVRLGGWLVWRRHAAIARMP